MSRGKFSASLSRFLVTALPLTVFFCNSRPAKAQLPAANGQEEAGGIEGGVFATGPLPQRADFTFPAASNEVGGATAIGTPGPSASATAFGLGLADASTFYFFEVSGPGNVQVPISFGGSTQANLGTFVDLSVGNAHADIVAGIGNISIVSEHFCVGYGCAPNTNGGVFTRPLTINSNVLVVVSVGATVDPETNSPDAQGQASANAFIQIDPAFAAANPEYTLQFSPGILNTPTTGGGMGASGKILGEQGSCTCPPGSGVPGAPITGDPITIATGNVFEKVTDYASAGLNQLVFQRYYNSLGNVINPATNATTFGVNWRSTFDRYIDISSGASVAVERADANS